jgi:hypothetical protein
MNGNDLKVIAHSLIEVLSRNLIEVTEENHENP